MNRDGRLRERATPREASARIGVDVRYIGRRPSKRKIWGLLDHNLNIRTPDGWEKGWYMDSGYPCRVWRPIIRVLESVE